MPSTSYTRRPRRPWLLWGVPITVVVLLAASAVGIAGRNLQARSERRPEAGTKVELPFTATGSPGAVSFSPDAVAHPDYDTVRSMLQLHFDSINQSIYERWETTVVEQRKRESPKSKWEADYLTTADSDIKVHRIEPGPDGSLRVLMTFTSEQVPEDSPDGMSTCLRWRVVYPLVVESGQLLLDASQYSRSSDYAPC